MESHTFDENAWKAFAEYYKGIAVQQKDTAELLKKLNNDTELAVVIKGVVRETALEWIERKIPALNNGKPVNFVKTKEQKEKLKTVLMRMTEWT
jgi:hypothetical protein